MGNMPTISIPLEIDVSKAMPAIEEVTGGVDKLKTALDILSNENQESIIPGFVRDMDEQISITRENVDHLMSYRTAIDNSSNDAEKQLYQKNFQNAYNRAIRSVMDLANGLSASKDLGEIVSADIHEVFTSAFKPAATQIKTAFNSVASNLAHSMGSQDRETITSRFLNSSDLHRILSTQNLYDENKGMTDQAMAKYAQAIYSTAVSQINDRRYVDWGDMDRVKAQSIKERLPSAFRQLPLTKAPERRALPTDKESNTLLTAEESKRMKDYLLSHQYVMREAEQAGLVNRHHGDIYWNSNATRGHVNAFGGNILGMFESGVRGGPSSGIDSIEDETKLSRHQRESAINKNNAYTMNSENASRFLADSFEWIRPTYTESQKPYQGTFVPPTKENPNNWENIGKMHGSVRQDAMDFYEINFSDIQNGKINIPKWDEHTPYSERPFIRINRSMMQNMLSAQEGADQFVHNGLNKNEVYVRLPVDELSDYETTEERKQEIRNNILRTVSSLNSIEGQEGLGNYQFTGLTGTHMVLTRKALKDQIESNPDTRYFFGNGIAEPEGGFKSYEDFAKRFAYGKLLRTEGESVNELWGISPGDIRAVVADMKELKNIEGMAEQLSGNDGMRIVDSDIFPQSFQHRDFGGKGTSSRWSMKALREAYKDRIAKEDIPERGIHKGDLVLPRGGINGGELVIPEGTTVIDDMSSIKAKSTLKGMTQEEANAERTRQLRAFPMLAKSTAEDFSTDVAYISAQEASTLELSDVAKGYFRDVGLKTLKSLDNVDSVKRLLFSGQDSISKAVREDESYLQEEPARARIREFRKSVSNLMRGGNLIMPQNVAQYALLQSWVPDIFNSLIGEENLTDEQRAMSLKEAGKKNASYNKNMSVSDTIAYFAQSDSDLVEMFRNPSTSGGNIVAGNAAYNQATGKADEFFSFLADTFKIDKDALYVDSGSDILKRMQGADVDGDTAFAAALRSNSQFREIMLPVLAATAERYQRIKDLSGLTDEEQAHRAELQTKKLVEDEGKTYSNNNPDDVTDYIMNLFKRNGMMGLSHSIALKARQLPLGEVTARALRDVEDHYDVVSTTGVKSNKAWDPTDAEWKVASQGNPFYRMYEWARKATSTEADSEGKLHDVFDYESFAKRNIEKVNFASKHDPVGSQADLQNYLIHQLYPEADQGNYDWDTIFKKMDEINPIDTSTASGKLQRAMRDLQLSRLKGEWLALDNEGVSKMTSLSTNAYAEILNQVKKEANEGTFKGKDVIAEAQKRFHEIGGDVLKFELEHGWTSAFMQNDQDALNEITGTVALTGSETPFYNSNNIEYVETTWEQHKREAEERAKAAREKRDAAQKNVDRIKKEQKQSSKHVGKDAFRAALESGDAIGWIKENQGLDDEAANKRLSNWQKNYRDVQEEYVKANTHIDLEALRERNKTAPIVTTANTLPEEARAFQAKKPSPENKPVESHKPEIIKPATTTEQRDTAIKEANQALAAAQLEVDEAEKAVKGYNNVNAIIADIERITTQAEDQLKNLNISKRKNNAAIKEESNAERYFGKQFGITNSARRSVQEMLNTDNSIMQDYFSSSPQAMQQQQHLVNLDRDLETGLYEDFFTYAQLQGKRATENAEELLDKQINKPTTQKKTLDEQIEELNQLRATREMLLNKEDEETGKTPLGEKYDRSRMLSFPMTVDKDKELTTLGDLQDYVTGELGKNIEEKEKSIEELRKSYTTENEASFEDVLNELAGKIDPSLGRNSPKVISQKRLKDIRAAREVLERRHNEKFYSDDIYKEHTQRLDELERMSSVEEIEKQQAAKTLSSRYQNVSQANQLADIVERANGIGRFALNAQPPEKTSIPLVDSNEKKIDLNAQKIEQQKEATRIAEEAQTKQEQTVEIQDQNEEIKQIENQQEEDKNQKKQEKRQDSERDIFEKKRRAAREDVQKDKSLSKKKKRELIDALDRMSYQSYDQMNKDFEHSGSVSDKAAFTRMKMQDYDQEQGKESLKNAQIGKARELLLAEKQRREANGQKFNAYDKVDSALQKLSSQPYERVQEILNGMDPNSEVNKTIMDFMNRPEARKAGQSALKAEKLATAPESVRTGIALKEAEEQRRRDQERIDYSARRRMEKIQSTYLDQESFAPLQKGRLITEEASKQDELNKQAQAAGEAAYQEAVKSSYSKTASEIANKYIDSNKSAMEAMGIDTEQLRKMSESFSYEQLKNMAEQTVTNGVSKEGSLASFAKHVLAQTEIAKPHDNPELWEDRDKLNEARTTAKQIKQQELFDESERIREEYEKRKQAAEDAPEVARIKAQEKLMEDKTAAEARAETKFLESVRAADPNFEGKSRAQQEADIRNEAQAAATAADKEKYAQYFPQAAIETTAQAVESIPSETPKVDASAVQQAEQQKAQEAIDNVASAIGKSDVGKISTEEPKEDKTPKAPAKSEEPQKPAMTQEEYEAAAKTAQVAQGIREQIQYLGGLKNRNAYEEATYQRLLAINPETNPQHYEQVQQSFLQQQQAQQEAKDLKYQNALNAMNGGFAQLSNGEQIEYAGTNRLALDAQLASYDQFNNQRAMRGSRSRAGSFIMQDRAHKQQLQSQVNTFSQKYAEQKMKIEGMRADQKAMTPESAAEYEKQITAEETKLSGLEEQLKASQQEFDKFNSSATEGGAVMQSFGSSITMAMSRFGRQMFRKALNDVKQFVKQFDKSMTEIQMITLKSDDQISELGSKLIDTAKSSGSTVSEVTAAASNLYRQGLSDEEVTERLDDVIKFSKVSGVKTTEASKIITTAMQNGLVGNSTEAMDALVALGDSAATTASEIAKGMQKSAAAAKQSGMSYGELVTLLTMGTSKTQLGGSTIGASLNTLIYRLYKVNKGQDFTDENGNHIASTDATKALSRMGISLFDDKGNFRGPYQILQDIAAGWEGADDVTQSAILSTLGAGRQRSNIATLIQGMAEDNGELAEKYKDTAENSQGITDKKYDQYLDSLEAKQNQLKSTWDEFINSMSMQGGAKVGLSFITGLVDGFAQLNELAGGLPSLIMGVVAAIGVAAAAATVLAANPAFMAMLPYIAAIAGIAAIGSGIGMIISSIANADNVKEQQRQEYLKSVEEKRDNFVNYRGKTETEAQSHIDAMKALIKDRQENPEDWTSDKEEQFQSNFAALAETFPELQGSVTNASASLESMTAAVNAASNSLNEYKNVTEEQKRIIEQPLVEEEQRQAREAAEALDKKYAPIHNGEFASETSKDNAQKDFYQRFINNDGSPMGRSRNFLSSVFYSMLSDEDEIKALYGEDATPEKIEEYKDLSSTLGMLMSTNDLFYDWSTFKKIFNDNFGMNFDTYEDFETYLKGPEAKERFKIDMSRSKSPEFYKLYALDHGSRVIDVDNGAYKDDDGWYKNSLVPMFKFLYSRDLVGNLNSDDSFERAIALALINTYSGNIDKFEEDALAGFTLLREKNGPLAEEIISRYAENAMSLVDGTLYDAQGNNLQKDFLAAEVEEKKELKRTNIQRLLKFRNFGDDIEQKAIENYLMNDNSFDPTSSNAMNKIDLAIAKREKQPHAFDYQYAPDEFPIKYTYKGVDGKEHKTGFRSLEEAYSILIDENQPEEKQEEIKAGIRRKIAKQNKYTFFSDAVSSGLMAADTAVKQDQRMANNLYNQLNSERYIGSEKRKIQNFAELMNLVDDQSILNFDALLKQFPQLATVLSNFLEIDEDNNVTGIKEGFENDEVAYSSFMSILAGLSSQYTADTYETRIDTYNRANAFDNRLNLTDSQGKRVYVAGVDTQAEADYKAVYGELGNKIIQGRDLNDIEREAKIRMGSNYAHGVQGLDDYDKVTLSEMLADQVALGNFKGMMNRTSSDVISAATSYMSSDYIEAAGGLSAYNHKNGTQYTMEDLYDIREKAMSENATPEDIELYNDLKKAVEDTGVEYQSAIRAQEKYQDSLDQTAEKLKNGENYTEAYNTGLAMQSKDLKTANDGMIKYNQTMNSILAAQYQRRKFYEGKGNNKQIAEMIGMTEKQVGDYKNKGKIEEQLRKQEAEQLDMVNAMLKGQTEDLQDKIKANVEENNIQVDLDGLEVDLRTGGVVINDSQLEQICGAEVAAQMRAIAAAMNGQGVETVYEQFAGPNNEPQVRVVAKSLGEGTKGAGGGGGGGKSGIDKLIEKQKHIITEITHKSNMLQIKEQRFEYNNSYGAWERNIDKQIRMQEKLRKAYAQNISELKRMLSNVKKGSDDWYKLKEAIQQAQEEMAKTKNTINELNEKKINIIQTKADNRMSYAKHRTTMLDKYAQRAMTAGNFKDYVTLSEAEIKSNEDQIKKNNKTIDEWKKELENTKEKTKKWYEIRDKIFQLEEENAELENSILQKRNDLLDQQLNQIAKVLQYNTQRNTHNISISDTLGNYLQGAGYRDMYGVTLETKQRNNNDIIKQNIKAKKEAEEQLKGVKKGTEEWYKITAEIYKYEEAIAQAKVTQLELNKAMQENELEKIKENYSDATNEIDHTNDALQKFYQNALDRKDYKAYFAATDMYLNNITSKSTLLEDKLKGLNKLYKKAIKEGADPNTIRQLRDEIKQTESELQQLGLDTEKIKREVQKVQVDALLEEQSLSSSNYEHNQRLLGYDTSTFQSNGELTNQNKALKEDNKLRKNRIKQLDRERKELDKLLEEVKGNVTEENRLNDAIKKNEESRASENAQIDKNNKLITENTKKIKQVRKALEDSIDKEIEEEKKRKREILSANVSMQDTIVNLLKKRLQDEWNLKKKDIEKEKESLSEYKKLINERFNYRKNAAQQADREEELADYRRQLALLEADVTRTKEAKELRRKIEEMEKENAWTTAEDELNAENERIDEQMEGMDKFVQYNEELLNDILGDANNFADEMNNILSGSFEESYKKIMNFMKLENEAFIKSLPDAQQQMIQSWEDTWKKAKDIIDTNYPQIKNYLDIYDSKGNLKSYDELSKPEYRENYIKWMKNNDQDYRKAREEGNNNTMKLLEIGYGETFDNFLNSIKSDYKFTPDTHTLSDVKSSIDDLKDNIYQVKDGERFVNDINSASIAIDDIRDLFVDLIDWVEQIHIDLSEGNETPTVESYTGVGSTDDGNKNTSKKKEEKEKGKDKVRFVGKHYERIDSTHHYKVDEYSDGSEKKYKQLHDFFDGKCKLCGQSIKPANKTINGTYTVNAGGGLVDYTGFAWVDGTPTKPEAFLSAKDTSNIRAMLNAFDYVQAVPVMSSIDPSCYSNTTNVGDINITINQAELKSDADIAKLAKQVGQAFTRELQKDGLNLSGYSFA